jgi:hypothetical protein
MSSYRPLRFLDASARADEIVANYKLGIGTHSQSSEMHVLADAPEIRIQDEVSEVTETALRITADGGAVSFQSGVDFTNDSKGDIKFQSMLGATTHMTIDGTNSRVGIGLTDPGTPLHVSSPNFVSDAVGPAASANTVVRFSSTEADSTLLFGLSDTASYISSFSKTGFATERNLILNANGGNVGIGTTQPTAPLDVVASSEGDYIARFKNSNTGTDEDARIMIETSDGGGEAQLLLKTTDEVDAHIWHIATASGLTPSLAFQYGGNSVNAGTSTAMTITNDGYVGINTSTPESVFSTYGGGLYDGDGVFTSKVAATLHIGRGGGSVSNDIGYGAILEFRHSSDYRHVTIESVSEGTYSQDIGIRFKTVDESTGPEERMRIDAHGNVGVGTTNPFAKLHINGSSGALSSSTRAYFRYNDYGSGPTIKVNAGTWGGMSLYASSSIVGGNYIASHAGAISASDERIKKNIVDADDAECLEVLRLLKPKKYQYKDVVKRGEEPVWGFIAQEVANVLPYSTHLRQDFLPNIYELANVSSSNVITFSNFNTSNLETNATIQVMSKDDEEKRVTIAEVIDEHTIRVNEDLSDWIGAVDETGNLVNGNQLFIYGEQIDDFMFVKKDAIWTVATSALQEVDRQLQDTKAQLASVLARLDALENA